MSTLTKQYIDSGVATAILTHVFKLERLKTGKYADLEQVIEEYIQDTEHNNFDGWQEEYLHFKDLRDVFEVSIDVPRQLHPVGWTATPETIEALINDVIVYFENR